MSTIHRDHMEFTRPLHAMSQVSSIQAFPAISSFACLIFIIPQCELPDKILLGISPQVTSEGCFHAFRCRRVYLSTPIGLLLRHVVLSVVTVVLTS